MIIYSNTKITYAQVYYDEPYIRQCIKADVLREIQYSKQRFISHKFETLQIDLRESEDSIFSAFEKNTKYEINRAKNKDALTIKNIDLAAGKNKFYSFYSEFASIKGLPPLGTREVDLLINEGYFKIRAALDEYGEPLVYHTYVCANGKARLAHSASLFRENVDNARRNLIGRANRLLHWEDMLYFKENGYTVYDLGGINTDKNNVETQAINRFKECFGGDRVVEFNSLIPLTLKGFLYIFAKSIKG